LAGTKTRRSTKIEGSFKLTTIVYFYRKDGKVHVELLKEVNAHPTEGALCLHHQLNHWQLLVPRGHIYSVIQECPAKGETKKAQVYEKPLSAAKADEKLETTADTAEEREPRDDSADIAETLETTNKKPTATADTADEPEAQDSSPAVAKMMETTNERPAAIADTAAEPEAQDSSADIAEMLETTNDQPATTAGTTDKPEGQNNSVENTETPEPTNEKPAATSGTTKKSEVPDTSTDVAKTLDATYDKPAANADTDDAPDTFSNVAESKGGSRYITTGITPLVKSRIRKERVRVCPVWATESHAKIAQPAFLIDDNDNGPDSVLIEWASSRQMVRLPYCQITFELPARRRGPMTPPVTTARAKRSSSAQSLEDQELRLSSVKAADAEADAESDEEVDEDAGEPLKGRFAEQQHVLYTDPDGEGGEVFATILEVHEDEYTILLAHGKIENVLESTLSPLPAGVDYLLMSEIERENFVYERFEKFQQGQIMKRADGYERSGNASKDKASLANVSPTDQPGHGGDLADNHLPTLAAPATILNVDKIKKQLQAAEKAHEANAKKYNRVRAKFRASKRDVDTLKRMLEEVEGKSDTSNVVIPSSPNLHDQRCYYRPFCKRMARDCGEWTRTGCEDFKPKDKFGREGPRRKELPGGTDGAVFRKRKREFDAPKLREIAKKSMRKKREIEKQEEKTRK
jgi:hypothetical protein